MPKPKRHIKIEEKEEPVRVRRPDKSKKKPALHVDIPKTPETPSSTRSSSSARIEIKSDSGKDEIATPLTPYRVQVESPFSIIKSKKIPKEPSLQSELVTRATPSAIKLLEDLESELVKVEEISHEWAKNLIKNILISIEKAKQNDNLEIVKTDLTFASRAIGKHALRFWQPEEVPIKKIVDHYLIQLNTPSAKPKPK